MNANRHRIRFDTKTIDLFWLLGFSAWRSIEVYSPAAHNNAATLVNSDNAAAVLSYINPQYRNVLRGCSSPFETATSYSMSREGHPIINRHSAMMNASAHAIAIELDFMHPPRAVRSFSTSRHSLGPIQRGRLCGCR